MSLTAKTQAHMNNTLEAEGPQHGQALRATRLAKALLGRINSSASLRAGGLNAAKKSGLPIRAQNLETKPT
jgi:hypothetical protein